MATAACIKEKGPSLTANQVFNSPSVSDPNFISLARAWMNNPAQQFLGFIWAAYDEMRSNPPEVDCRDLERSITQLLEPRVRDAMTGDEPFYIQHGSFERETMQPAPAQPPEYDLAFVLRADERIMWPLEAKVLETSKKTANYIKDIENEFLTCRYAPFSGSGAMLGFLLDGSPDDAFKKITEKLECSLETITTISSRPNRVSRHSRTVPIGKSYPSEFECYHLMLEFLDLERET